MRGNTIAMLVIAVIFGAVAVFAANIWMKSQRPVAAAPAAVPAQVEIATIVVASIDLKFGEPLTDQVLREISWPKAQLPDGSYAKIEDVIKDGRRVALGAISVNEPILKWKISGPGARASLSAAVKEGMRAVTVRVNQSSGVAGFVLPGDRVDVLYTRSENEGAATIDILLQNVRVLAIDQTSDERKSDPIADSKVVTLELEPVDAQKISLAQETGALTLTLRSAGALDQAPAQRVVEQELVSNPSVYQTAFDQQAAAQAAINDRIKGLESTVTKVETKLTQKIETADLNRQELLQKLSSLEASVQQAAKTTGDGEVDLRKKLSSLEAAIRATSANKGQGEDELRRKLAEFEGQLRAVRGHEAYQAGQSAVAVQEETVTANIKVYRGMDNSTYSVPLDANPLGSTP